MLRIIPLDAFERSAIIGTSSYSSETPEGQRQSAVWSPMFLFDLRSDYRYPTIPDVINTGGLSRFGDRPCSHTKLDGDLYYTNQLERGRKFYCLARNGEGSISRYRFGRVIQEVTDFVYPGNRILYLVQGANFAKAEHMMRCLYAYLAESGRVFITLNQFSSRLSGEICYRTVAGTQYRCIDIGMWLAQYKSVETYHVYMRTFIHSIEQICKGITCLDDLVTRLTTFGQAIGLTVRLDDRVYNVQQRDTTNLSFPSSSTLSRLTHTAKQASLSVAELRTDHFGREVDLGDATGDAANRVRYFDGNTALWVSEALTLASSLKEGVLALANVSSIKDAAGIYLSNLYGPRLTLADAEELGKGFLRHRKRWNSGSVQTSRGGKYSHFKYGTEYWARECHCIIRYNPYVRPCFKDTTRTLMDYDLFPSFQNIWDMIPYSFVVNWFVDVESFLNDIDTRTYMSTLDVYYYLYSEKLTTTWESHDVERHFGRGIHGNIRVTRYDRWLTDVPYPPKPSFEVGQPMEHIPELSALILQRT